MATIRLANFLENQLPNIQVDRKTERQSVSPDLSRLYVKTHDFFVEISKRPLRPLLCFSCGYLWSM